MNWQSFFTDNKEISCSEAKELLEQTKPGELQLIDVRLPREFREHHLPGAQLVPLNDLLLNLDKLDRTRKTIVYCRTGSRSGAACQILRANGFSNVLNLRGGIVEWQGHTATGSENYGLDFFLGANYDNAFAMAYAMESGLQEFYRTLAVDATDPETIDLLRTMEKFEDGHKAKLAAQYKKTGRTLEVPSAPPVLEGGLSMEDLWSTFGDQLQGPESILHLAMSFEAQAYDMYIRLSRTNGGGEVRDFYLQMAEEERKHLDKLAKELDKLYSRSSGK